MLRRTVLGFGAGLVLAGRAAAQGTPAPAAGDKKRFVVFYSPGPAFDHAKGLVEQPGIRAHGQYLQSLLAQGRLVMAGPFMDNSNGGMSILEAASLDEARALVGDDPTVKAGLLKVEVKPWLTAFSRPFAG
jgi:uncharacterized protein YciI